MSSGATRSVDRLERWRDSRAHERAVAMRAVWRNFRGSRSALIGLALVVGQLVMALTAPALAPYDPTAIDPSHAFEAPSITHWFGTDQIGRDVLSRVMYGGRVAITISLVSVTLAVVFGGILGMAVGYLGGWFDEVVMRVVDAIISIPYTIALLVIVTALGSRTSVIIAALAIHYAPGVARSARAATLGVVAADYVTAARSRGESTWSIVAREIRPNIFDVLMVEFALRVSWAILLVSTLSFLGLGVQPPTPDWGAMVQENNHYMAIVWWATVSPVVAISVLVIGLNLVADGIAKAVGLDLTAGAPE